MKKSLLRYRDLPAVSVETSPVLPGATTCAVRSRGVDQVQMMLLAEGLVSVFGLRPEPDDDVALALARVVTAHSFSHSQPGPDLIADLKAQAACPCPELAWDDLPVLVSAPRAAGRIACYPLAHDDCAALVLASDVAVMPVCCVTATNESLSRPLLLAVGRTLLGHHGFLVR